MKDASSFAPESDLMPHSVELEQNLLGAVLTDNERFHKIGGLLTSAHFYDPVHARIWSNISARISRDHLASPVTLKSDMEADEGLKQLGGPSYLARLAAAAIGSFAVVEYARELIELHGRRLLIHSCEDARAAIMAGGSASDAASGLELALQRREETGMEPRSMSLLAAHTRSITQMNEAYQTGAFGISTGLKSLDDLIGGLRAKETTVVAGSTSMGKTSFGTFLAYTAAKAGYGVGFASLEMSEEALSQRINSIDSEIPYQAMNRPMSENVFRRVVETAKSQEALPIQIYSDRVRDIPSILSETKRLRGRWEPNGAFKGLGLLVIDYIQLVRGKGSSYEVLSQVARDTKAVAKLMGIPVIAMAQISRDVSKRESHRPHLSDLRGAGDLEDAADNVIFCHRPEYYLERMDAPKKDEDRADYYAALNASKGKMDLIVAKQRMGPLGTVRVCCDLATNRFWDIPEKQPEIEF